MLRHQQSKLPNLSHDENRASRRPGSLLLNHSIHHQFHLPPSSTLVILGPAKQSTKMFSRQAIRSVRAVAPQRALAFRAPIRSYAAAAESQPPIAVFGVDGTYASALVCLDTD